jgi:hypothetical protein
LKCIVLSRITICVLRFSISIFRISICFLCWAASAGAHERSESFSHWYFSGSGSRSGLTATVTIPLREVMLLYQNGDSSIPPRQLFGRHLADNVAVYSNTAACDQQTMNILQAASGFVRVELQFDCGAGTPTGIQYRALFDIAPGHVHYAKLHRDGSMLAEELITDSNDYWDVSNVDADTSTNSFAEFLMIGIKHISSGADHIAFLLGLLLIAGSLRRSVIAVTGFTLGHSTSLAAAVFGFVRADGQLVEAFIGFTVALVAVEYFLVRRRAVIGIALACTAFAWSVGLAALLMDAMPFRSLFAYLGFGVFAACYLLASRDVARISATRATTLLFIATACFGLVHGFGFAGFLMDTGLLGSALLIPLLGFNLGVEIGQLILVAAVLSLVAVVPRQVPRIVPQLLASSLCGIGVLWFIARTLN